MADKVDNIMEHMLPEFEFYQREELFSIKEIKQIVKHRRQDEYLMFRKDAAVEFFIDAINYEKELWSKKNIRKAKHPKNKRFDF